MIDRRAQTESPILHSPVHHDRPQASGTLEQIPLTPSVSRTDYTPQQLRAIRACMYETGDVNRIRPRDPNRFNRCSSSVVRLFGSLFFGLQTKPEAFAKRGAGFLATRDGCLLPHAAHRGTEHITRIYRTEVIEAGCRRCLPCSGLKHQGPSWPRMNGRTTRRSVKRPGASARTLMLKTLLDAFGFSPRQGDRCLCR